MEELDKNELIINNTDFSVSIINIFKKLNKEYEASKDFLKFHQYIIREYIMRSRSDFRGMLIYFETGEGKTYLAVALAEYYKSLDPGKKIVILSAKSLADNIYNSLLLYMTDVKKMDKDTAINEIINRYKFVSSNASNMAQQLRNIRREDLHRTIEKKMGIMVESEKKFGWLENSVIIVDEAHNVFNSIINGSKNGLAFYDMVINTKNIKLLFLTGTPIINNPFEIVPCFNMLMGKVKNGPFFPETQEDFDNWFIDKKKLSVKNKDKLSNYLIGRISYYGSYYVDDKNNKKKDFPEELPINIVEIPMSLYQYNIYNNARESEKLEKSIGNKQDASTTISKKTGGSQFSSNDKKSSSTYRVKTRQISNYVFPENLRTESIRKYEELKKMKDKNLAQKIRKNFKKKMMDKLQNEHINMKGLEKYSPKILQIIKTINDEMSKGKSIGMVYSEFVTGEGLGIFEKVLCASGWKKFTIESYEKSGGGMSESFYENLLNIYNTEYYGNEEINNYWGGKRKKNKKLKKKKINKIFAVISGNVDPEDRTTIINALNSKENIDGNIISLLLISSTGAEGLDLKGIRYVLIMEPYWNMARLNQIKARGIRYKSHEHLSQNEKNVSVYLYLSIYPENILAKNISEPTTDKYLYETALNNQIIIDKFLLMLMETSVDCFIHRSNVNKDLQKKINCKVCRPTNKPLYYDILSDDINLQNNCIEIYGDSNFESKLSAGENLVTKEDELTTKITAKELILDGGIKIYYTISPKKNTDTFLSRIHIYQYKPALEGYTEMDSDNSLYKQIIEKIMKLEK